jgi:MFS family permease
MSFTSRWSDVYVAAGARGVSVCGDFLAATTLALVLQQAGHGGLTVSGLMVAAALPLALAAPISGRIADRVDSRTVLVVAGLAQAAICLVLAFTHQPVAIIGLVALLACGLAVTQPTLAALVPEMVREEDLAKASGINQTAGVIGMMIAPALAGVLVGQTGSRLPLLLDAASYLALVVAGFALRTRRHHRTRKHTSTAASFRLRDDRVLTVMVGAMSAVIAGVGLFNVVAVFLIRDTLGASTTVFGLVEACWTVGMLVGGVLFARVPRNRMTVRGLLLIGAATCVPMLAAAAAGNAGWLVPLWLLGGIGNAGANVYVMVIVADRTAATVRGRAFAVTGAAFQGAGLAGLLLAGPLVERFEPRPLVALSAALGLLIALICLVLVRPSTPGTPAAVGPERARDSVRA